MTTPKSLGLYVPRAQPGLTTEQRRLNAQKGCADRAQREGRASPALGLRRFSWEAVDECGQTG